MKFQNVEINIAKPSFIDAAHRGSKKKVTSNCHMLCQSWGSRPNTLINSLSCSDVAFVLRVVWIGKWKHFPFLFFFGYVGLTTSIHSPVVLFLYVELKSNESSLHISISIRMIKAKRIECEREIKYQSSLLLKQSICTRGVNGFACEKNRFRFGKSRKIIALTPAQRSTHPEKRFKSLRGLKVIRFEVSNLRIFKRRVNWRGFEDGFWIF